MKPGIPLIGLVVCGGRSWRMGTDKGLLEYRGRAQREEAFEFLRPVCDNVFMACNAQQAEGLANHPVSVDLSAYEGIGPMAALLTAFERFPESDFLTLGCDYPLLTAREVGRFRSWIPPAVDAAAFWNAEDAVYDPLLAFYSHSLATVVRAHWSAGKYSLQNVLRQAKAAKYLPEDPSSMQSVDTQEEFWQMRERLAILGDAENASHP